MTHDELAEHYLRSTLAKFRELKSLAEGAFAQLSDEEFFRAPDEESNSVAVIAQHMSGNMLSRWTDFLTADGEKPGRDRDAEFAPPPADRAALLALWEDGWRCLFAAVEPLRPADLGRSVRIRSQPHTVVEAITRQLAHYAYHVGQIVFLAKHLRGAGWKSLSIPKGQSSRFKPKELRPESEKN